MCIELCLEGGFPLGDGGLKVGGDGVGEGFFCADFGEEGFFACVEEFGEGFRGGDDFLDVDGVEVAILDGPEEGNLELDGLGREGWLLEELNDAGAAVELLLGARVEV